MSTTVNPLGANQPALNDPGEDLTRVTVISALRRIDLALPAQVTLAELMPTIVRFSGFEGGAPNELGKNAEAVSHWVLQRLGEDPLDPHRRVAQLKLRDGDTLHLRQRAAAVPEASFDDLVDAVTTSTSARPDWRPVHAQRFALTVLTILAILGPAYIAATTEGPWVAFGLIAMACAAGFAAALLGRVFGHPAVAATLAWITVGLASIGGFWLLRGVYLPPQGDLAIQVLTASSMALAAAGAMALTIETTRFPLAGVAMAAFVVVIAATITVVVPGQPVEVAAVGLGLVMALTGFLPRLSYAAAGVVMPNLPSTAEGLKNDRQRVQPDIVKRALTADRFLGAYLLATGVVVVAFSLPLLTADRGWTPIALVGAAALAVLLRARAFTGRTQRLVLLIAGTLAGAGALAAWVTSIEGMWPRAFVTLLIVSVALWGLAQYAATMYDRVLSPVWGRWGDILEWFAVIAIVPLVLAVVDLYGWAYGLAG